MRNGRKGESGSMAIEIVLVTPLLVGMILVIAAGARYVDARGQAGSAAYSAARAASLTTSQEAAVAAGRVAATRSFAVQGRGCAPMTVSIDAHDFQPGGDVRATIACTADLSDLTGFGLPVHKTFTATATVPLEAHREFP